MSMKLKTFALLTLTFSFLMVPGAFAQDDVCGLGQTDNAFCRGQTDPDAEANPTDNVILDILDTVVDMLTMAVGAVALIVIIISGLMYVVSAGDPSRANKARSSLIYAVVALLSAVFARAILLYVLRRI